MNSSSHFFDPQAFLHPFDGREEILELYLNSIPAAGLTIQCPVVSAKDFGNHLEICPSEERRILRSGLIEAWEMACDEGHEQLLSVLRLAGRNDPELLMLPAECLALKIMSGDRELFESALSLDQMRKCDALELFKPRGPVCLVEDINAATNRFRGEIAARCGEKYGSRRILLRRFEDSEVFTIGFYFEKAPKTRRKLAGDDQNITLAREEDRPIQYDAVMFEPSTGVLSVRSGYGRLTEHIRKAFAAAFLENADAYEWAGAANILDLTVFVDEANVLTDIDGGVPVISEMDYAQPHDPLFTRHKVISSDVIEALRREGTLPTLLGANIRKVILQMALEGSNRRRRVVLTGPNKIEFKRGTEAARILTQLRDWYVLQSPSPAQVAA
jgi:hypothetical protein